MKYVLGVLGVILVVILAIVLITRGGRDRGPAERPLVISEEAREGVSAIYAMEGALVGQNQRKAVRVIVNQNERRLEILTGYEEAVERAHTYPNTPAAFEEFMVALDYYGFGNKQEPQVEDPRGACPLGKRYIFDLREYSQELLSSWSTSCSRRMGSFAGNLSTIRRLFEKQIPDYKKQIQDVDLEGNENPDEEDEQQSEQ